LTAAKLEGAASERDIERSSGLVRALAVHRQYPESGLRSRLEFARIAMVQPADPRKCDDLTHFSGFDRPLFWSVLF
jgi:hypothetical protein